MKIKLKLMLLLAIFSLNCVSYSSAFCKAIGENSKENLERAEKDPSKKRTCTFSKIGKKIFGESGDMLGIAIDVGINGNRIFNKKPKKDKNSKTDIENTNSTETTKEIKGKGKNKK